MGFSTTEHIKEILDMVGVPRLSREEIEAREKRKKQYSTDYNADPENKKRKSEYNKKYNQDPKNKVDHNQTQARYRITLKGRACDDRYWKKMASRSKKKDKNDDDNGISVRL